VSHDDHRVALFQEALRQLIQMGFYATHILEKVEHSQTR
jgi:hypothetical protein